jgi:hypothetical protein
MNVTGAAAGNRSRRRRSAFWQHVSTGSVADDDMACSCSCRHLDLHSRTPGCRTTSSRAARRGRRHACRCARAPGRADA